MDKNIAKLANTDPGFIIKLGGLDTSTLKKLGSVFDDMEAELEAVRKLLGRWLAGEESVGCKCTICNDTRKFLKGGE